MHPHDDSRNYVGKKGNLLGSIRQKKTTKKPKKKQSTFAFSDPHLISIHPGSVRPGF